jgi:hypothetical protein
MNSGMIHRYHDIETDEAKLKRLTGLKRNEFEALHHLFKEVWQGYFAHYTLDGTARTRQASVRKNSIFADTNDALLFGLIYLNGNMRQEQLAAFFNIDQPKASKYLSLIQKFLLQILESHPRALPKRKQEKILKILV